MKLNALIPLAALALLQACATPAAPPPAASAAPQPPLPRACSADSAAFAQGQTFNTPLAEEARQRAGAETVRVLRPGQIVTMEFSAQRLTLDVDAEGRVTRARCG